MSGPQSYTRMIVFLVEKLDVAYLGCIPRIRPAPFSWWTWPDFRCSKTLHGAGA
jgi:hypothetical protein